MIDQLKNLIALQKIDFEIAEYKDAIAAIPGQIESVRSTMQEHKKQLEALQQTIESLKKKRNQLELDIQGETDHMAKAKVKLPTVKTNREYSAILTEINAIKEKISGFEDRELEIMETLEEKEKEIPGLEKECREEENQFKQYQAKKEGEAERVKKDLDTAEAKRRELVNVLDPKWIRDYEKVFQVRDGRAVVPLKEGVCQGCFQQVLPQMVIDIKISEKIHQCQHCLRFLYWEKETESETAVPK
ncbi:MAG: zinc ribbon domain-containing protein [Nitrospinaceae bacterium]